MAKHVNNGKCPYCQEMLYANPVDPVIRDWFESAQAEDPTLHLSECYRSKPDQDADFRKGASKAKFGQSPHSYLPVLAVDVFFFVNGKGDWSEEKMRQLASKLPDGVEWGGDFPGKFKDKDHFQRKNWKSLANNYPNGNKP